MLSISSHSLTTFDYNDKRSRAKKRGRDSIAGNDGASPTTSQKTQVHVQAASPQVNAPPIDEMAVSPKIPRKSRGKLPLRSNRSAVRAATTVTGSTAVVVAATKVAATDSMAITQTAVATKATAIATEATAMEVAATEVAGTKASAKEATAAKVAVPEAMAAVASAITKVSTSKITTATKSPAMESTATEAQIVAAKSPLTAAEVNTSDSTSNSSDQSDESVVEEASQDLKKGYDQNTYDLTYAIMPRFHPSNDWNKDNKHGKTFDIFQLSQERRQKDVRDNFDWMDFKRYHVDK